MAGSRPGSAPPLVEILTLSLVLSVTLTIVLGYGLLLLGPNGFQASWSDPVLETVLVAVAGVALVAGLLRRAYSPEAPTVGADSRDLGEEGAWELLRELEALNREERRLRHRMRVEKSDQGTNARLSDEMEAVHQRIAALQKDRESEYAQ